MSNTLISGKMLCRLVIFRLKELAPPSGELTKLTGFPEGALMYGFNMPDGHMWRALSLNQLEADVLTERLDEAVSFIRTNFPDGHAFIELPKPSGMKEADVESYDDISARVVWGQHPDTEEYITRVDILVGPAAPQETSK